MLTAAVIALSLPVMYRSMLSRPRLQVAVQRPTMLRHRVDSICVWRSFLEIVGGKKHDMAFVERCRHTPTAITYQPIVFNNYWVTFG